MSGRARATVGGTGPGPTRNGLRRTLRLSTALGLAVVLLDAVLLLTGAVGWSTALVLLLSVEVPLLLLALVLHVRLYRQARAAGEGPAEAWEVLLDANPPLRLVQAEAGHVLGLARDVPVLLRRGHHGAGSFGYSAGTLAVPLCLLVVILVETALVHLLLPWAWLRLLLLAGNLYAVLVVSSVLTGRIAHPHRLVEDRLRLHVGRQVLTEVPLQGLRADAVRGHQHTWLAVTGEKDEVVHLATQFGTNVRLLTAEHLTARLPRALGPDRRVSTNELHLMVDDPEALLAALRQRRRAAGSRPAAARTAPPATAPSARACGASPPAGPPGPSGRWPG